MGQSKVLTNLNGLGVLLGGLEGLTEAENDAYMGSVIRAAHRKTTNIFDLVAAATARAGVIQHMWEYGTPGITQGRPEHTDPTTPDARLYVHQINGRGPVQDIGFGFRPAKTRNPNPTVANTGVSSKYLQKLSKRKHVFWNKAMVMETGQEVTIAPKNGRFLFIPFRGEGSETVGNKKNFVLWDAMKLGPITVQPGRQVAGNFTSFWFSWWNSEGERVMSSAMLEDVNYDIAVAIQKTEARAQAEGRKLTRAESASVRYAYKRSQKLTEAMFKQFTQEKLRGHEPR